MLKLSATQCSDHTHTGITSHTKTPNMPAAQNRFHWLDYVVFIGMLSISSVIGIYHAFKGGKQKTRQEYLLGDRKLAIFPVFVSVLVSYMSALSILGLPSEVYHHGIQYSLGKYCMLYHLVVTN